MLEIEFFAATVAGSSGSGVRSRYSAHCEGERWEGGGVRRKTRGGRGDELRLFVVGRAERRAARLTSPAVEGGCCCAKHPEMHICRRTGASGLRGAGERCRRHRAGRSCRVGRTSHESPQNISKYLFCVVPEHASRCPTKSSSPWSADRVFHRTSLDGASSEAPRSTAGVVLSETTPWTKR